MFFYVHGVPYFGRNRVRRAPITKKTLFFGVEFHLFDIDITEKRVFLSISSSALGEKRENIEKNVSSKTRLDEKCRP